MKFGTCFLLQICKFLSDFGRNRLTGNLSVSPSFAYHMITKKSKELVEVNSSYNFIKRPPVGVVRKFGEGVPVQVPYLSSDRNSELRGPFKNSPRVASQRDVIIT
ncbi:hypothetical protein AVEN_50469-1 [Araneus ventricosus]|uniref:Uncharacterized protein n=1 Tax=Araneus ventricosus TaxID=182803 RepID=A0A4Y2ARP7_ARAVE|nr:hypothetical protein AVEN_50469-1 [Araneus ventricosus]